MSLTTEGQALDNSVERIVDELFVKDPNAFLKDGKAETVRLAGDLAPLFAIQSYVECGMIYPQDEATFKKDYPESTFEPLKPVLPEIYAKTAKSILTTSQSCNKFQKDVMQNLLAYPNIIITYCDNAIELLEDEDSGLMTQLNVLLDKKYKKPEDLDDAFNDAKEIAKDNLTQLKDEADKKEKSSGKLRGQLDDFRLETENNKALVKAAEADYSKRICVGDKEYSSAIKYLDSQMGELEKAEQDLIKKEKDAKRAEEEWDDPGHWKFWFSVIVAAAGLWTKEDREAHKEALKKVADKKDAIGRLCRCRLFVLGISEQFEGLLPRMAAAIDAINNLWLIFNSQVRNFEELITKIDRIGKGVDSTSGAIRRSNITAGVKYAIARYKKIKEAAEQFEKKAKLKVKEDE